jgi:beta-1,4-mannosyltransferase
LKKLPIACLPVAGKANPYQHLMMQGLNADERLQAFNGVHDKFFGILRTCLKFRPNYIHFDWETSYYYRKNILLTLMSIPLFLLQIWMVRFLFGCRLVWTPHNLHPHDLPYPNLHRKVRRFFASQMHWIRLFSARSLEAAVKELQQPKEKFRFVPEGSYASYYPSGGKPAEELRRELAIPEQDKVLLYLGLIKPYKGILELVKSFQQENPDKTTLLICGKSMNHAYFEKVRQSAEGNPAIRLMEGFVPEDNLPAYYELASAVILPFRKIENSGSVIMAMGYKKAIIAPAMGVLLDRLCRQQDLLFEGSPTQALHSFYSFSEDQLKAIGEANRQELEKYHWKDFAACFAG